MISQAKKMELLLKHGKNFAFKDESRPILQGIHYAADGSAVVNDGHQMLRIKDAHTYPKSFTYHATAGYQLDGVYPDTNRIWPTDHSAEVLLSADRMKDLIKLTKMAVDATKFHEGRNRVNKVAQFSSVDSNLLVKVANDQIQLSFTLGEIEGDYVTGISFNVGFLLNALNVFNDASSREVSLKLISYERPIVMTDEDNGIDILWAPIRV